MTISPPPNSPQHPLSHSRALSKGPLTLRGFRPAISCPCLFISSTALIPFVRVHANSSGHDVFAGLSLGCALDPRLPEDRNQTGSLLQRVLSPAWCLGGCAQQRPSVGGLSQPLVMGWVMSSPGRISGRFLTPLHLRPLQLTLLGTGDAGSPRTQRRTGTGVSFCLFTDWSQLSFPPYLPLLCCWSLPSAPTSHPQACLLPSHIRALVQLTMPSLPCLPFTSCPCVRAWMECHLLGRSPEPPHLYGLSHLFPCAARYNSWVILPGTCVLVGKVCYPH